MITINRLFMAMVAIGISSLIPIAFTMDTMMFLVLVLVIVVLMLLIMTMISTDRDDDFGRCTRCQQQCRHRTG